MAKKTTLPNEQLKKKIAETKIELLELLIQMEPENMTASEVKISYWLVKDFGVKSFMKRSRQRRREERRTRT